MKIIHGGLRLSGRTLVTNRLVASAIRSRTGRPLLIESTANVTLTARNSQGRLVNSLKLSKYYTVLYNLSVHCVYKSILQRVTVCPVALRFITKILFVYYNYIIYQIKYLFKTVNDQQKIRVLYIYDDFAQLLFKKNQSMSINNYSFLNQIYAIYDIFLTCTRRYLEDWINITRYLL